MPKRILTQERVKELLRYYPESGTFIWIASNANCVKVGTIAGSIDVLGYLTVTIDYNKIRLHRLAFLYMLGELPEQQTDHINGNRSDNRWNNLRAVDATTNAKNKRIRSNNKSGVTGVYYRKDRKKWAAQIKADDKVISLGVFTDLASAANARKMAEKEYGYHENHGRSA